MKKIIILAAVLLGLSVSGVVASTQFDSYNNLHLAANDVQTFNFLVEDGGIDSVTVTVTWDQPNRDLALAVGYESDPNRIVSDNGINSESVTWPCDGDGGFCEGVVFVYNQTNKSTNYDITFSTNP